MFLAYQFRPVSLSFGPGLHPFYADLLLMGFGGYMLGAIAADSACDGSQADRDRGPATDVRVACVLHAPAVASCYTGRA